MTNKRIELNPISISYILQPNGVNLSYFKIWQFDLAKFFKRMEPLAELSSIEHK